MVGGNDGLHSEATLGIDNIRKNVDAAIKHFARLQSASQAISKNQTIGGFDTKPLTGYQNSLLQLKKQMTESLLESERLRQENIALRNEYNQGRIEQQKVIAQERNNRISRQELARSTRESRLAQVAANGSYDEATARLKSLGREIRAAAGGFNSTNPAIRAQIQEYNRLNQSLKEFDATMGNHQRNVGNYGWAISGIVKNLAGMASAYISAGALISAAFTTALKTDAIRTSLEFTFGSVDVAQTKLEELEKTANRLGLEYTSLADSYRSFAGAAVASNFPLQQTDKIFNAVANAGAKLKLSSDQVTGALTALQQMISKGNVQSEELRGQLGERLPGAFAIAARSMGVTQQELGKLLKDGKILAYDLLPKLADELDKTFSYDKNEKVTSLQGSVNELKNSYTALVETKGALSSFFTFVVDAAGGVVKGIQKMSQALGIFYDLAKDPKKFIGDSAKISRNAGLQDNLDNASKSALNAVKNSGGKSELFDTLNAEKKILAEVETAYKKLKEAYNAVDSGDRSLAQTKRFQQQEKSLQFQIQYVRTLSDEYNKLYSTSRVKELADADLTSVKAIQARITELKKLEGSAIAGNAIYDRILALQDRLKKPNLNKTGDQLLNDQRTLQAKIDDLHFNATKKQLSNDDQEVASIKQKYVKINNEIEAFYAKVNNRDTKYNGKTYQVNISTLKADQAAELAAADANAQLEKDKQMYDAKKVLFNEYESYKLKVGENVARERFAKELGDFTSFVDFLNKQMPSSEDTTVLSAKRRDYLNKITPTAENDRVKANQQYLTALLDNTESYERQRAALTDKYNKNFEMLQGEANASNRAVLTKVYQDDLNALKDSAIEKTNEYKSLSEETLQLTKRQVKEQLKALNNLIDSGGLSNDALERAQNLVGNLKVRLNIDTDQGNLDALQLKLEQFKAVLNKKDDDGLSILSPEETKRILNELGLIQIAIDKIDKNNDGKASWGEKVASNFEYLSGDAQDVAKGLSEDLGELSNGFNSLSQAMGGTDTEAGYLFDTIGKLTQAGSEAAGAFASFSSGDIIGGISKTMSAISSVLSIGKKVKEMNAAARKEVEDFYQAAIDGEIKYQSLLRQRELETATRGKNSYQAIVAQLDAIKKQSPELEKAYSKVFEALQGQQYVDGMGSKHGTWLRKAKTWDILASLSGADYSKLEQLYSQGKLKDAAKADFEALKSLRDELESLGLSVEDLQKQLGALLTGTSVSGLAEGLSALFANGTRSAEDFGKSFEEIIKNSLLSSFKAKYLEDALQPFYNELAEMMKGSIPTDEQIAALKDKYIKVGQEADTYLKNIETITGQDLKSGTPTPKQGISGVIVGEAITEGTANRLLGISISQHDTIKTMSNTMASHYKVAVNHFNSAVEIAANTFRTANNTDGIADKLDQIVENTSGGTSLNQAFRNDGVR